MTLGYTQWLQSLLYYFTSQEVPLLEAKIRQINTKYFEVTTELVKLKEENEKLHKKCNNVFSSSYKISGNNQDGKSEVSGPILMGK